MSTRTSSFRRTSYPDPGLRVSDAERNEVADRLARHYSDGRLTQEEFNERVEQAMKAKTQADLDGLFSDLPDLDAPAAPARPPRRHGHRPLLILALIVALALTAGHGLWWFFVPPWLVIVLIAATAYAVRGRGCRQHRDDHRSGPAARP